MINIIIPSPLSFLTFLTPWPPAVFQDSSWLSPCIHIDITICSDHHHPSYLFDDSVRVVEERQGDNGPRGDGEAQQVPGNDDGDDGDGNGNDGEAQQVPGNTSQASYTKAKLTP